MNDNQQEVSEKFINLTNMEKIIEVINEVFARKDYVEYLENRIEILEKNIMNNTNV